MATTKVIPGVLDLNQASSSTGLKMPSSNAAYSGPTVAEGMMRNEVGQTSASSASCMQHFNGTDWKNYENLPNDITTDFLVVGGGGSGGYGSGGGPGGGAGGLKTTTTYSGSETPFAASLATAYTVVVGTGAISTSGTGDDGADSKFGVVGSEIISTGGGGGNDSGNGRDGGSGGGGGNSNGAASGVGGAASPAGQGNVGGNTANIGTNNGNNAGGGGGGAGAVGSNASSGVGGNGGAGLEVNIIGGTGNYYAGGGGGVCRNDLIEGTGGIGGGGAGGWEYGNPATINTGGGGGGGRSASVTSSGGSGTVILRYPTASVSSFAVTGTLDTVADTAYPIANKAYYKLNGDALDSSGNGYDGTFTTPAYGAGIFGQAAVFNGTSSSINLNSAVLPANNFSVSMWINTSALGDQQYIITQYELSGTNAGRFILYLGTTGFLNIQVGSNGSFFGSALNTGTWYHLALVKTTTWECYLNGASIGTWSDTANITTTRNTQIGSRESDSAQDQWNGSIDQVRIFNSAISAGNVTSLYNEGTVVESTDGTDSILQFIGGTGTVTFS